MTKKQFRPIYMAYFGHDIGYKESRRNYLLTGRIENMNKKPNRTVECTSVNYSEVIVDSVSYPVEVNPRAIGLGTCRPACSPYPKCGKVEKEEGNNPMYANNTTIASVQAAPAPEAIQRKYLSDRAYDIKRGHLEALRQEFNYYNSNDKPTTYKELIDAIKNDKFTLDEKLTKRVDRAAAEDEDDEYFDDYFGYTVWTGIKFTDFPGYDYKGFDAASKALRDEFTKIEDTIAIMDPKDALAALQEFEKWTYTKPTLQ